MYSITANTMYTIDENGKHSLEISYNDSEGVDVGAYAEGDSFEEVIFDAVDQIDEAIAEFDDDQADMDEAANLQAQIADLQAQIAELQARNDELKKRHDDKLSHKPSMTPFINNFQKKDNEIVNKINDFPFTSKWWV